VKKLILFLFVFSFFNEDLFCQNVDSQSPSKNSDNPNGETINNKTCKISPFSTTPGFDDFIAANCDFSSLQSGNHSIILQATDINDNVFNSVSYFNISELSIQSSKSVLIQSYPLITNNEEYPCPNPDWGQVFTGSYFHTGFADSLSGYSSTVRCSIKQENIPLENCSTIRFSLASAGGGAGYEMKDMGIRYERISSGSDVEMIVRFQDANGFPLGSAFKTIYYDDEEGSPAQYMLSLGSDGALLGFANNPGYKPEEKLRLKEITINQLIKDANIADISKIKYVSFEIDSMVHNDCYKKLFSADFDNNVWVALNITGIPWDTEGQSPTQQIVSVNGPKVYPNPYKDEPGSAFYRSGGILFSNLGEEVKLHIYSIGGEQIFSADNVSDPYEWDLRTSNGDKAASGVYIYVITDSVNKRITGKLAVLR